MYTFDEHRCACRYQLGNVINFILNDYLDRSSTRTVVDLEEAEGTLHTNTLVSKYQVLKVSIIYSIIKQRIGGYGKGIHLALLATGFHPTANNNLSLHTDICVV